MSAYESSAPGVAARAARAARPLLSVVPRAASRAPRVPFVVLVVVLLGVGLVGLLLVNTSLQQGAFALHELERRTSLLGDQRQRMAESLAALEAPATLAGRARGLGMVPMTSPVFLRLSDGKVLGVPAPAQRLAADSPLRGVVPLRSSVAPGAPVPAGMAGAEVAERWAAQAAAARKAGAVKAAATQAETAQAEKTQPTVHQSGGRATRTHHAATATGGQRG